MRKIWNRKKSLWGDKIVFFIAVLLGLTGIVSAVVPDTEMLGTPHKPAYVQTLDDLVKVDVPPHIPVAHPSTPTTTSLDIVELIQQLDESMILGYLENLTDFGPRETGTQGCEQAANYIYHEFESMGLSVRYHNYTDGMASGSNIEATLYGSEPTNIFIICGHYDTVSEGPGADDDGSGVAATLAAAEILSNYEFTYTIRFVAFSGEEQGLVGSHHYAQDAYDNNDVIVAVLNADMIGYAVTTSDGTKGKIYENDASEWIVTYTQEISQLYEPYIGITLQPQGETWGSDHYYFWEYGYDAVFYHEFNFNDYYHSADDTIAHMNITYSTMYSRLILATLASMAQQPRPILEISNLTGGFGLTAELQNVGDVDALDVNITLALSGGLLGLYNISYTQGTPTLTPSQTLQLDARPFRLGPITILVTAEASNADTVTKEATAFLLGPFVLKLSILP